MRREERVTVQGPVKEQQPDEMSNRAVGVVASLFQEALAHAPARAPRPWPPSLLPAGQGCARRSPA